MNWLLKFGQWIRLLDENGLISITNISMWVSLYRLVLLPNPSYAEVGTFMLAAAAYNYKRTVVANLSDGTITAQVPPQ